MSCDFWCKPVSGELPFAFMIKLASKDAPKNFCRTKMPPLP
jgi:hypothetical protein